MPYDSAQYLHDLDKKAFAALNTFPSFIKLQKAFLEQYDEKTAKISFLSSGIRLSENQMSEIYSLLPPICEKLGIVTPELYYMKSEEINAFTCGSTNPYICITSELVNEIPVDFISSVLAHECGHIACQHYLYHSLVRQLINGIDSSPLVAIPGIKRLLIPSMIKALLFWDRCSEFSADRAAVLCDGDADKTVDVLLKIHGFDENINRKEFLKQAIDLKEFVNSSKANKIIETMLVSGESHPRMAARAYECYEWAHSEKFQQILNSSYLPEKEKADDNIEQEEVISGDVSFETVASDSNAIDLDKELQRVSVELDRYTSNADKSDYAFSVLSGIMAGAIDAMFIGETIITDKDIGLSHKQVNNFIQEYAKARGFDRARLKDAIVEIENAFKVPQDNVWFRKGIGIVPKNHRLADLAHHPTPLGLTAALIVQFFRIGSFVNKDGEWLFILVKTTSKDLLQILAPAVITGILNWLVFLGESQYEEENGNEVPEVIHKLSHLVATTPIIIEVAKCADNWFGHLVSDMGRMKNNADGGMGIPGIFLSLLYEISALPILKDTGLTNYLNGLYVNHHLDLRYELSLYKSIGKQAVPVIFNEIFVRVGYFVSHLAKEISNKGLKGINWAQTVPFGNRTINRMLTVASMTFTVADTTDAAVHAALESAGNWVMFSGRFAARFNYVGAGRAAFAIIKEVSSEKKEAELLHEKLILTEAKTELVITQIEAYKAQLEAALANYLAEDIEVFITGFDTMTTGLASNDSDTFIKGNVIIQTVLGREPQFRTQAEFDRLMDSDSPLIL